MRPADPEPYRVPEPDRQAVIDRVLADYLVVERLEPAFARRFLREGARSFVELGSASGPISRLLASQGVRCIAVDKNPPPDHFQPLIRADLRAVPLRRGGVDAVSAVNCLYFLGDPRDGIREAFGLLRPGGLFLASAPSRYHDPELKDFNPSWGESSPFDAEDAAGLVGDVFPEIEVEWWEAPAYVLPDIAAVRDYFAMFTVYRDPGEVALSELLPLTVTKSGANVWARKSG